MKGRTATVLLGVLLPSYAAQARTVRVVVAIGDAIGDPGDQVLRYTEEDVDRFISVFVDIGNTSPSRVYKVVNQDVTSIRERLSEVRGRMTEIAAAGDDPELVLYVSAHAAKGELHLFGSHWPLSELRDFLEHAPARLRLLFIDTCQSGQVIRVKGARPAPEYDVDVSRFPLSGTVVVSSSGPAEPSEEWDSLAGSLFTHYLLTGLRGDADSDHDGKVTLAEAYAYTFRRTVANASRLAQHPALDVDVAGAGELVLTEPSTGKGSIVFPAALAGHFIVTSVPRPDVVAELDKRAGEAVRIAVPPGRYLLRRDEGASIAMMSADLPFGGEMVVDEKKLIRRHYTEVTLKGSEWDWEPHALLVGGVLESPPIADSGVRWAGEVAYRRTFGQWWAMAGVSGGAARYNGVGLTVAELDAALTVSGGYRWFVGPLTPCAGLAVRALGLRQSFRRTDEAELQADGYPGIPNAFALALAAGPAVALEVPLTSRLFALVSAEGLLQYLRVDEGPTWTPVLRTEARLGVRF